MEKHSATNQPISRKRKHQFSEVNKQLNLKSKKAESEEESNEESIEESIEESSKKSDEKSNGDSNDEESSKQSSEESNEDSNNEESDSHEDTNEKSDEESIAVPEEKFGKEAEKLHQALCEEMGWNPDGRDYIMARQFRGKKIRILNRSLITKMNNSCDLRPKCTGVFTKNETRIVGAQFWYDTEKKFENHPLSQKCYWICDTHRNHYE